MIEDRYRVPRCLAGRNLVAPVAVHGRGQRRDQLRTAGHHRVVDVPRADDGALSAALGRGHARVAAGQQADGRSLVIEQLVHGMGVDELEVIDLEVRLDGGLPVAVEDEVVAVDEAAQTIETQMLDGAVGEYDQESWQQLLLEPVEEPEDWREAYELSQEDSLDNDTVIHPDKAHGQRFVAFDIAVQAYQMIFQQICLCIKGFPAYFQG